jgi:hypothetical protein
MNDCTCGRNHDAQLILLGEIKEKTEANGERLDKIDKVLTPLMINCEVCKAEGRAAGKKWGAMIAAAMVLFAEAARRIFP